MHKVLVILGFCFALTGPMNPALSQEKGKVTKAAKKKKSPVKAKKKTAKAGKKGKLPKKMTKKEAQARQQVIDDATHGLKSPNPEKVLESVQVLAMSGAAEALGPLTDLLRTGPRNDITNAIIQALGLIAHEDSITILVDYLNHRRPDARVNAIYALENYKDPRVIKALEEALRDSDKQVRATAAIALGKIGSVESVPILFRAFERGVFDCAISIGQLGTSEHASRLAEYLGRSDINVLLPGFDEFLRREDFQEKAKLAILQQLFELAGPDVRRFAVAYKASFPPETDENENELYKMVSRMVRQIQED